MDLKPKPSDLRRDFQKSQEILGEFKTWICESEYSAPTTGHFDNSVYISLDIKAHRKISHWLFCSACLYKRAWFYNFNHRDRANQP